MFTNGAPAPPPQGAGKEWARFKWEGMAHTMWPVARYGQALLQGWEAGLDSSKELLSSEILVSPPVLCK